MKRSVFLNFPHTSDCCEENECVVERSEEMVVRDGKHYRSRFTYRLLEYPSWCKCGHPIHLAEPSQAEMAEAFHAPESEAV